MNRPPLLSKAAAAHIDGVWVGGRLTLTESHLLFGATGTYRRVVPDGDLVVPLAQVASVTVRAGVLTRIITVVRQDRAAVEVRCHGADEAAAAIRAAVHPRRLSGRGRRARATPHPRRRQGLPADPW